MPSLAKEIWKAIPGYNGQYEASNLGRIRATPWTQEYSHNGKPRQRKTKARILATSSHRGYVTVSVKDKTKRVHHLVMLAFVGPMPVGYQVNHKDGNKSNNRKDNLEYKTPSGNIQHAYDTGLHPGAKGKRKRMGRLTENQAREILELHATKSRSRAQLAKQYSVTVSTVALLVRRKTWKHVE